MVDEVPILSSILDRVRTSSTESRLPDGVGLAQRP